MLSMTAQVQKAVMWCVSVIVVTELGCSKLQSTTLLHMLWQGTRCVVIRCIASFSTPHCHAGTGSVMLSGETANGKHPALVVSTMADIVANAELGVNYEDALRVTR